MQLKNKKSLVLFFGIILLAVILRFYKLGQIPVSLYWDEAAVGYNAYSIATNLHDEHGAFLPILFRSFGEYKMPLYIYLTAVSVKIFGLTEFAVRFWSATLGVIGVMCSYFLATEILTVFKLKRKLSDQYIRSIALLTMFLMSISIWDVHFSRIGFEANGLLTAMIVGFWLLLRGLHEKKSLIAGAITLALGMYFYRAVIGFLPFMLFVYFVLFYQKLFSRQTIKTTIIAGILFVLIATPITIQLFSSHGLERTHEVSIFNGKNTHHVESIVAMQTTSRLPLKTLLFNRRVGYALDFLEGYTSHLSPQFLFYQGDTNPRHNGSNSGVLYMWVVPFLLIGLYSLWKLSRKACVFVVSWILIAPIPAALSIPTPHALRSLNMIPMPDFLTALGIISLNSTISPKYRKFYAAALAVIIYVFVVLYLQYYYTTWPAHSAESWGDGHKEMVEYVKSHESKYDKIVISGHYWQPYIYTLFYTQFDPIQYQKTGSNRRFSKYLFGGTSWDHDQYDQELDTVDLEKFAGTKKILVVLSPYEYHKQQVNLKKLATIKNNKGDVVFIISKHL